MMTVAMTRVDMIRLVRAAGDKLRAADKTLHHADDEVSETWKNPRFELRLWRSSPFTGEWDHRGLPVRRRADLTVYIDSRGWSDKNAGGAVAGDWVVERDEWGLPKVANVEMFVAQVQEVI